MNDFPLLTITVFLPLAAAVLIVLAVRGDQPVRYLAGAVALAELVLSAVVFVRYDLDEGGRPADRPRDRMDPRPSRSGSSTSWASTD